MVDSPAGESGARPDDPNTAKQERRVAAMQDEMGRVIHRLYTLSVLMMRVDAAWEAYHAAMLRVVSTGRSNEEIIGDVHTQVERVENNDFLRAHAHLTTSMAMLHVVVEGWRKWRFFDTRVDELLDSPKASDLRKYRHAIFHAELFGEEGVMSFARGEAATPWVPVLQNELRRALRDWHASLPERVEEYLRRSPL